MTPGHIKQQAKLTFLARGGRLSCAGIWGFGCCDSHPPSAKSFQTPMVTMFSFSAGVSTWESLGKEGLLRNTLDSTSFPLFVHPNLPFPPGSIFAHSLCTSESNLEPASPPTHGRSRQRLPNAALPCLQVLPAGSSLTPVLLLSSSGQESNWLPWIM